MTAAGLLVQLLAAPMAILADLESTGEGPGPAGVVVDLAVEPATSRAALVKRLAHLSRVDVADGAGDLTTKWLLP